MRLRLILGLLILVVFAVCGCGNTHNDGATSAATDSQLSQQFPAALTSRVPPSNADLAELADVPSDVKPDPHDVSRVRLRDATAAKYFVGHWGGPPDNPGRFFCVYRIDPGERGAAADCFGTADFAAGVPTITSSRNRDGFELFGFVPDPQAQIAVQLPSGTRRLVVSQNAFGLSTQEEPESIRITANGKTSEIKLN